MFIWGSLESGDFILVLIKLFFARCYGWGATSKNRSKIGYFAPTRALWSKISARRGRSPPIIFARIVRHQWMPYNFVANSFHTAVTAEALRAKIDKKSAILLQCGHFYKKFRVQGVAPNMVCEATFNSSKLDVNVQITNGGTMDRLTTRWAIWKHACTSDVSTGINNVRIKFNYYTQLYKAMHNYHNSG